MFTVLIWLHCFVFVSAIAAGNIVFSPVFVTQFFVCASVIVMKFPSVNLVDLVIW